VLFGARASGMTINDTLAGGAPVAVFTGVAGQLRSYLTVTGHMIEGDVNGDTKADFAIAVLDLNHVIDFNTGDFFPL
jgi:hypothetical protein